MMYMLLFVDNTSLPALFFYYAYLCLLNIDANSVPAEEMVNFGCIIRRALLFMIVHSSGKLGAKF